MCYQREPTRYGRLFQLTRTVVVIKTNKSFASPSPIIVTSFFLQCHSDHGLAPNPTQSQLGKDDLFCTLRTKADQGDTVHCARRFRSTILCSCSDPCIRHVKVAFSSTIFLALSKIGLRAELCVFTIGGMFFLMWKKASYTLSNKVDFIYS